MKSSMSIATFIVVVFLLQNCVSPRRINRPLSRAISDSNYDDHHIKQHIAWPKYMRDRRLAAESDNEVRDGRPMELIRPRADTTLEVAGSRLPDCSHACGSCSPCRLVIVGPTCASLTSAETCPISYRCMCNNKFYPVP